MSRGEKRSRSAEGRGRERGVVVISLSVARRGNRARSFVSHASRTSLPPPLPVREGYLSTWHYAAVNVQITPHLLHSKQRSFNDTRTGGGTVVNFSRDQTLSLSFSLFYRDREKEKGGNEKRSVFSFEAIARLNNFLLQQSRKDSILVDVFLRI